MVRNKQGQRKRIGVPMWDVVGNNKEDQSIDSA